MKTAVLRETRSDEQRVAVTPDVARRLGGLGAQLMVEAGAGLAAGFADAEYADAGVSIVQERASMLSQADLVLRIGKPSIDEVALLKQGAIQVSFLDPFNEPGLIDALRDRGITAISMEMIPRTTRAQKMDALSSQGSLAGYVMMLKAALAASTVQPMMTTPAGTIRPATVFVIGVGVAGLQAIATARRLGARVIAFDTRPETVEQVRSLGAKFLEIDIGETQSTKDGYAVQLTAEQLERQKQGQAKQVAASDIVITTAQVFGRKPPVLITTDMVASMRAGSVIVDMAAETGGNVEGSVAGQTVVVNGVTIVGDGNWASAVPRDASQMYASNLSAMVEEFWDKDAGRMAIDFSDDILKGCVITHDGGIVNETISKLRAGGQ